MPREDRHARVREFVAARCEIDPDAETPVVDIFRVWREWCHQHGYGPGMSGHLSRWITSAFGLKMRRGRHGSVLKGLRCRSRPIGDYADATEPSPEEVLERLQSRTPMLSPEWRAVVEGADRLAKETVGERESSIE